MRWSKEKFMLNRKGHVLSGNRDEMIKREVRAQLIRPPTLWKQAQWWDDQREVHARSKRPHTSCRQRRWNEIIEREIHAQLIRPHTCCRQRQWDEMIKRENHAQLIRPRTSCRQRWRDEMIQREIYAQCKGHVLPADRDDGMRWSKEKFILNW